MNIVAAPSIARDAIEISVIHKLRTRIIPFVFVLFVIAFVDRINIGFAALTMNKELAITSQQYGFVAGVFFFGYFIFEIPSNLLLHKLGARVWIARILVSWGILAILTGFVRTVFHLYVLRFLLGVAEAGYFPGMVLYLTYWFPQRRLAHAMALLSTGNPVASVVGAPISGMILDHIHWFGVSSWRWLLILEGIPAVIAGVATYALLPSRPAEASFLTSDEKGWIDTELGREDAERLASSPLTAGRTLICGRVWHLTAIYFAAMVAMYAMVFWMPLFIKSLSAQYSNTTIGVLVMVPFLAGLAAMILNAHSSDHRQERRYHAAVPAMIAALALLLLGTVVPRATSLAVGLWCVTAMGLYSFCGPFWALPSEFLSGFSAAAGIALINSIGNMGGFVGPYVIGAISRRTQSFWGGLIVAGLSLFVCAALVFALRRRTTEYPVDARSLAQPGSAALPSVDRH